MISSTLFNAPHPNPPRSRGGKRVAFTLAEVLITLGIIGVVAAMTIPTLMHKINNMVLQNQFKKAYSNLYNAYKQVLNDEFIPPTGPVTDYFPEFGRQIILKYKGSRAISLNEGQKYTNNAKNLKKEKVNYVPQCGQLFQANHLSYELSDGSAIGIFYNCASLKITLDTNGINNGPNALGYDIFLLEVWNEKLQGVNYEGEVVRLEEGGSKLISSNDCSLTASSNLNGATCAKFAIKNKCPWDDSKTYWECLP